MKNWIKQKLTSLLGVDLLKQENDNLKSELSRLNSLNEKIIEENNFLIKQFNISADINHYENHSWAVISIQGRPEYVKFFNLSNKDIRELHYYLKQFERTNRTIDSPIPFLKY